MDKQGRDVYSTNLDLYIKYFTIYLKGIDNIKLIEDYPLSYLVHHINSNSYLENFKIKDYKKYLPNIKHFKKYGHFCASKCAVECRYCYKCAEKIKKLYEKKVKQFEKTFLN